MKYKNYKNPKTGDNRIYTIDEISQMTLGKFLQKKDELISQFKKIGVPHVTELRNSENAVFVHEYTRDDGTVVKSHWRSKPDDNNIENNADNKIKNEDINTYKQGTITGGTSNIKQETKKEKDIPEITKGAELQENVIKNLPVWEVLKHPEQEYYRIAFELKESKKN
jgi:hypothetical protein